MGGSPDLFWNNFNFFRKVFSLTTAPQILHFEQGPCNRFECMLYYWQKERRTAMSVRCASSRENRLRPHLWPSTGSDYVDTVRVRAHESSDFRLKSTENQPKVLILQDFYGSGPRGRRFKSSHSDQQDEGEKMQKVSMLSAFFVFFFSLLSMKFCSKKCVLCCQTVVKIMSFKNYLKNFYSTSWLGVDSKVYNVIENALNRLNYKITQYEAAVETGKLIWNGNESNK